VAYANPLSFPSHTSFVPSKPSLAKEETPRKEKHTKTNKASKGQKKYAKLLFFPPQYLLGRDTTRSLTFDFNKQGILSVPSFPAQKKGHYVSFGRATTKSIGRATTKSIGYTLWPFLCRTPYYGSLLRMSKEKGLYLC